MYDAVLRIIRLGISIGEVWLCYQLMYLMILEKEYLRKKDKVIIWGNILISSVKNFVALVKNSSFLVRITDMTILIEKEFIYGSSKRPNPTDYYRK